MIVVKSNSRKAAKKLEHLERTGTEIGTEKSVYDNKNAACSNVPVIYYKSIRKRNKKNKWGYKCIYKQIEKLEHWNGGRAGGQRLPPCCYSASMSSIISSTSWVL